MAREAIGTAKLCIFEVPRLQGYTLALTFPEVLSVGVLPEFQPVPFSPSFVLGLCLWRDQLVSVIDLAAAMQGQKAHPANLRHDSRYLIGQTIWGGRRELFAWPIVRGTDTHTVLLSNVELFQDAVLNRDLLYSVVHSGGRELVLINTTGLVSSKQNTLTVQ